MNVVALARADSAETFGAKAAQLGRAIAAGLPVPPGCAVSWWALDAGAQGQADAAALVRTAASALALPLVARSSAIGEDSESASFAGHHLTVLNLLSIDALLEGLVQVHRSARAKAALAYRRKRGIDGPVRMAAVVQTLIDADCAGVLFTRNPLSGADELVIEAAWGLGETVVAGLVTPDHYRVSPDGRIVEQRAGEKDIAMRRARGGGTHEVAIAPALVEQPCLDDAAVVRLVALARDCTAVFGPAIDVEWAFAGTALYLLQARPITALAP